MKDRTRPAQAVAQCVAAALCGACGIVTAMPPAFAATPVVHTVTVQGAPSSRPAVDPRSFMHGIGVADAGNGKRWVFFSSSGVVPRGAMRGGSWPHDVYVGEWLPGKPNLLHVRPFISRPEAQGPCRSRRTRAATSSSRSRTAGTRRRKSASATASTAAT